MFKPFLRDTNEAEVAILLLNQSYTQYTLLCLYYTILSMDIIEMVTVQKIDTHKEGVIFRHCWEMEDAMIESFLTITVSVNITVC